MSNFRKEAAKTYNNCAKSTSDKEFRKSAKSWIKLHNSISKAIPHKIPQGYRI